MVEIKILKKDEIEKEFDLCVKAYELAGFTNGEYIRTMIEDSLAVGLAFYGGELAGVSRIVGDRVEINFIVNLIVLEKYQRKGIGKKLVQELAKSSEASSILLTNNPKDQGLKEFYKKAGFKESIGESVFEWIQ